MMFMEWIVKHDFKKGLPKYDYSNYKKHDDKNDRAHDNYRDAVESVLKIRLGIV